VGIVQGREPVLVDAFDPNLAVEGFEKGVVRRFSRSGKVQCYAFAPGPQVKVLGDELGAIAYREVSV